MSSFLVVWPGLYDVAHDPCHVALRAAFALNASCLLHRTVNWPVELRKVPSGGTRKPLRGSRRLADRNVHVSSLTRCMTRSSSFSAKSISCFVMCRLGASVMTFL